MPERLSYTVDETAAAMGISRSSVHKLLHTTDPVDYLPSSKLGRTRLIQPADIKAWLDRHKED